MSNWPVVATLALIISAWPPDSSPTSAGRFLCLDKAGSHAFVGDVYHEYVGGAHVGEKAHAKVGVLPTAGYAAPVLLYAPRQAIQHYIGLVGVVLGQLVHAAARLPTPPHKPGY